MTLTAKSGNDMQTCNNYLYVEKQFVCTVVKFVLMLLHKNKVEQISI